MKMKSSPIKQLIKETPHFIEVEYNDGILKTILATRKIIQLGMKQMKKDNKTIIKISFTDQEALR